MLARRIQGRRTVSGIGTPAQLLNNSLALRVEPGRISPASRVINGTARYTDPLRSGTPRQLQPKYGLTLNGSTEYATLAYVRAAHTAATVSFHVNDLGSAAADTWVAVGGTAGGINIAWTSDGFDLVVSTDASNYTTYAYNGGALSGFQHVAVTVSGTTVTAYVDGSAITIVPAATGTGFDGTMPETERVRIGADATDTAANHSNATFDDFRYFGTALSASQIADLAAIAPGSTRGVDVGTVPLIHYKFEDQVTSATCRNSGSLGSAADATITGTIANVRGTVSPVYSFANEVGYTEGTGSNGGAVGELIPRDESNKTHDIAGNLLQYTGQAPRDMVLSSPCATWDGVAHLAVAGLTGSETVVSSGGTSTPSISAGQIDFTSGTCWDLVLSNGSVYPFCEGAGAVAHDTVGGEHGVITGATLATLWQSAQQNISDTLVESGYSVGTWFDGSNDSFTKSGRLTSGTITALSACCWLVMDVAQTQTICSESLFTGDQRSWNWRLNASRQMEMQATSSGGIAGNVATSPVIAAVGELVHVGFVYDGANLALKWFVNGALVETDSVALASFFDSTSDFIIGNVLTTNFFEGVLSQLVVEQAVWGDTDVASLKAAGTSAEVRAIRPDAWYFPDAKTESLQSLPALTVNGAPEQRIIPVGTGLPPASFGPGLLAPGQSLDLYCGEGEAPICQLLATLLTDGDYDFDDGSEGNSLYRRGDANGEQIAVIYPEAQGSEFAVLEAWDT